MGVLPSLGNQSGRTTGMMSPAREMKLSVWTAVLRWVHFSTICNLQLTCMDAKCWWLWSNANKTDHRPSFATSDSSCKIAMLSLRQLLAQQSQESTQQEDGGFEEQNGTSDEWKMTAPSSQRVASSKKSNSATNRRAAKRKVGKNGLPNSDRKSAAKKVKHEQDGDSSSGEEWFGDNESETDWKADYEEFGKSYTKALSAIYKTGPAMATPVALASFNLAFHPTQKKSFAFQSRVDKLQPRTRELKRHGITQLITETEEEAQNRVTRHDRYKERQKVVNGWKSRAINYTLEDDVGFAFQTKAKRLLGEIYRTEQRQQLKAQDDTRRKEMAASSKRQDDDDDSEKEQDVLLNRLTQNSIDVDSSDEEQKPEEASRDPTIPYKAQMDFWEYGRAYPGKEDLVNYSYKDLRSFNLVGTKSPAKKTKETQGERQQKMQQMVPFTTFLYGRRKRKKENFNQPRYFLSTNLGNTERIDRFSNLRHLRTIAVRQLCTQIGDTMAENRLIQCLLTKTNYGRTFGPLADFDSTPSSRTMAYQLAKNLLFYNEHSWTNHQTVAEHLGLVENLEGCTVPPLRVIEFFKRRRAFVAKHYMKGKRQWNGEGNQQREPATASTLAGGTSAHVGSDDHKVLVDPPTSAGIIFELKQSEEKRVGDGLLNIDGETTDETIAPTNAFAYVPGTNAPTPNFPMEPPGILFGPVDRHAKFCHNSKLDETTFHLVLSTLLARMANGQETAPSNLEELGSTQALIKQFVEDYVRLHSANISVFFEQVFRMDGASMVPFYRALMSYCSLVASGCLLKPLATVMKNEETAGTGNTNLNVNSEERVGSMANQIVNVLADHIDRSELLRFPKLRVMYALARVASNLPQSAAELLSTAVDGVHIRTPLDVFRRTLEHMEQQEMIVSENDFFDSNSVEVGSLEYTFFKASQILQQCVKVDSLNVDYHLWYIGALGACLLLCSGNKIGGGAYPYPSERKGENWGFDTRLLHHEVRQKLPKFEEMRLGLSTAVRLLLELAKHQEGARIHLAISSFLEWSEVVGLLVGDSIKEEIESLQKLHTYHSLRWVLMERPPKTQEVLKKRSDGSELSCLALELENKPGNIENWRAFVRELGPLGYKNSNTLQQVCPDHDVYKCSLCQWLRDGLVVDHQHWTSSCWWGANRFWWVDNVLQVRSLIQRRWKKFTEPVMQELERDMTDLAQCNIRSNHIWNETRIGDLTTTWLPTETKIQDQERTTEERSHVYDSTLPQPLIPKDGFGEAESEEAEAAIKLPDFDGPRAAKLEMVCYKILIFAHLSSDIGQAELYLHGLVEKCIFGTSTKVEGVNQDCDEFRGLQWLCYVGLHIPKIARANYNKCKGIKSRSNH